MNLLLVVSRYPWPARRGDQLRTQQFLELLGNEHRLTLLAPEPPPGAPPPPIPCILELYGRASAAARGAAVATSLIGGRPLQNGLFHSPDLGSRLRRMAAGADLVILQLVRLEGCLEHLGEAPVAVDFIDSLSLNMGRRARCDARWRRPLLELEARRLAAAEGRMLAAARGALVVCERDRRALLETLGEGGASGARLGVLPLAFPLTTRQPEPESEPENAGESESRREREMLVMTGNLGYFPAVEGFGWWLRRVWPELHRRRPGLRVVVAGARPAAALRRRARAPGVELVASPPDLGSLLAQARVALAPLRCGSGQPLKILEAWLAGVPVVASPWAAAGTGARHGEELLIAENPEEWRAAVERLLDDRLLAARLVAAARLRLEADYGREVVGRRLRRWVEECVLRPS